MDLRTALTNARARVPQHGPDVFHSAVAFWRGVAGDEAVDAALKTVWPVRRTHTRESCKASALNYKTRGAWGKADGSEYLTACRNGWLEECCGHMTALLRTHTLESCMASALKYTTRKAWQKSDGKAYAMACRHGWMDQCCAHMTRQRQTHALESCKASALPYGTRVAWQKSARKSDRNAYVAAYKRGWLDACCAHMTVTLRTHTLEGCRALALQYSTRTAWQKGDKGAYSAARKRGWLEACCAHMLVLQRTHTPESCKASALKYKTRSAWEKADGSEYLTACRNGWLEECCAHMGPPQPGRRTDKATP